MEAHTNEELAALIRQGDDGYLPQLWDQVRRFIAMQAKAFLTRYTCAHGYANFELDDLINEAYLGMLETVKRHDSTKGKFLTILDLCIRTSFASVAGLRTKKQDACDYAKSLDAPLAADESGESTLYDLISFDAMDVNISDNSTIAGVEESIYTKELRAALEMALARLPKAEARALRLRYFFDVSYADQAKRCGKSRQYHADLGSRGIWNIRENPDSMVELAGFLNPAEAESGIAVDYARTECYARAEDLENYLLK